jgi:hypothetical protein
MLLHLLRNVIPGPGELVVPMITGFVAETLRVMLKPAHALYTRLNRFLLARPQLDPGDIPMLYNLLHPGAEESAEKDRRWMLKLLLHNLKTADDYALFRKRHVFELLQSLFDSTLATAPGRTLIWAIHQAILQLPAKLPDFVLHTGVFSWLATHLQIAGPEGVSSQQLFEYGGALLRRLGDPPLLRPRLLHSMIFQFSFTVQSVLSRTSLTLDSLLPFFHFAAQQALLAVTRPRLPCAGVAAPILDALIQRTTTEQPSALPQLLDLILQFPCDDLLRLPPPIHALIAAFLTQLPPDRIRASLVQSPLKLDPSTPKYPAWLEFLAEL